MNEKNEKPESGQETGTKKSGLAREGIAYLIFGVLTTVIDYAISNLLYYMWKMDPVPAQITTHGLPVYAGGLACGSSPFRCASQ